MIYPFKKAVKDDINYVRKSVTGSSFSGNTKDIHGYCFGIHGFFDWRNILIAKAILTKCECSEIIEIGANIGTETIGFADLVGKKGKVHAFEPLPQNIEELEQIARNNSQLSLQIYPVAIGASNAIADFLLPPENYSGIGKIIKDKVDESNRVIKVEVHKLDSYLDNFSTVKGIFIDTEGHEPFVLSGAKLTIQKYNPVVVLEVSEPLLKENSKTSMDIFSFFQSAQYKCYNIGRFFLKDINKENISTFHRHTNWICIPKTSIDLLARIKTILYIHIFLPIIKL
jgi:FkbM family methyltransferase